MNQTRPFVVGIAGGSGSGKTTICRHLSESLGQDRVSCLSCDQYYRSLDHLSPDARSKVNFDHPDAVDFRLLARHLRALRGGQSITVPQYCFATHTRRPQSVELAPAPLVLIEGVLLLTWEEIRGLMDLRLFIEATNQTRYLRRLQRDTQQRARSPRSIAEQWQQTVAPMYSEYVEPSRHFADYVISTEQEEEVATLRCVQDVIEQALASRGRRFN